VPGLFTARAALSAGLVLGVAVGALGLAGPAAASDLPAPTLSKYTVQRGESFTISGTGCSNPDYDPDYGPYTPYRALVVSGAFAGSAETTLDDGSWSLTMDVGGHLGPGNFAIRTSCATIPSGHIEYPTITVTVVGEPLPPKWWEPGGSGRPPGQPTGPPAQPPAPPASPSAAQQATPRTTTPTGIPVPESASAPPTTTPLASTTAPLVVAPSPAPGCPDCERLTGGEPLTAGDELTLSYSGFQPGEQVTVVMRSTPVELGTFTVDASGTVTANVTIPASAETGSHTLTLSGPVTGDQVLRFRLWAQRDDVAGPASDGTGLAMPLALGGAGLVLLAVGGLVVYRRRAATSAEPDHPAQGQPTETPISEPIP
jgi:hypothetical protein